MLFILQTALVHSSYEQMSQQLTQESSSLHNETLSSLKGEANTSGTLYDNPRFNQYSTSEMKKSMSQRQLQKHKKFDKDMKYHSIKKSKEYKKGVHFVSPIKIYSLLYLGLLIIKDHIQLGDLIRLIREGHLPFNKYSHLFPEEYDDKFLNIMDNNKNIMFSSGSIRLCAAKLAKFLDVISFIVLPNCTELCRRYCKDLNLPGMYILDRNFHFVFISDASKEKQHKP